MEDTEKLETLVQNVAGLMETLRNVMNDENKKELRGLAYHVEESLGNYLWDAGFDNTGSRVDVD